MDSIHRLRSMGEQHRDLYAHMLRWEFWFAVVVMFAGWMGAAYAAGPEYGNAAMALVAFGTVLGMVGHTLMVKALQNAEGVHE